MYIRYGTISDIEACQQIARLYRDELPFVPRPQLRQSLDQRELLVAEVGGMVTGFVRFHQRRDATTTLYDLAVSQPSKGVGAALVHAVPTPIQLKTTADNTTARRFYERLGFRLQGIVDGKKRPLAAYTYKAPLLAYVRGGAKGAPAVARDAGAAYGVRNDYKAYDWIFMLDIHWTNYDWNEYMHLVCTQRPVQAMCPDYTHPSQRRQLYRQMRDLKAAGVLRVIVCPKFAGAVAHIPQWCTVAVSVPTDYAGYLPNESLAGRKVHFLGGHPDQWLYLTQHRYPLANVQSVDGNICGLKAALGQAWDWNHDAGWKAMQGKKTHDLAVQSLRTMRYFRSEGRLLPLQQSPRVLRCAIHYEAQPKLKQQQMFVA